MLRDFLTVGSKDKGIHVSLQNFKPEYKMDGMSHVHSGKTGDH
jgi:hypothetical protein